MAEVQTDCQAGRVTAEPGPRSQGVVIGGHTAWPRFWYPPVLPVICAIQQGIQPVYRDPDQHRRQASPTTPLLTVAKGCERLDNARASCWVRPVKPFRPPFPVPRLASHRRPVLPEAVGAMEVACDITLDYLKDTQAVRRCRSASSPRARCQPPLWWICVPELEQARFHGHSGCLRG